MPLQNPLPVFVGSGSHTELLDNPNAGPPWGGAIGPWRRRALEEPQDAFDLSDHPEGYSASRELAEAVNTAIILGKPLLLTGRPGTGKSQLADRIAWEFNLSPVLRFEAQSMSESSDLFYRYDLVAQLSAVEMNKARQQFAHAPGRAADQTSFTTVDTQPERFITFGPLGLAILRAAPGTNADLLDIAMPDVQGSVRQPRPSVVLIDEIDKASRDFPNDLLNGIERLEFRVREMRERLVAAPHDPFLRPIVVITSNSERDLPDPFLRRCIYFHIDDPDEETLRRILLARVFPERYMSADAAARDGSISGSTLAGPANLYEDLLRFFAVCRDRYSTEMRYQSGPSELIDWAKSLRSIGAPSEGLIRDCVGHVKRTIGAVAKHRDDRKLLLNAIDDWALRK